jgi:hypothetical protein
VLGGLSVMAKQISLIILFLCFGACTCFSQSRTVSSADARLICNRIAEIKTLPMKEDPGIDAAYDAIVGAGVAVDIGQLSKSPVSFCRRT